MKKMKRLFLWLILIVIAVMGYQVYLGYGKYRSALEEKPVSEAVASIRNQEHFTPYDAIPEVYFQAVVAVEDRRFYQHMGFDVIGTTRAVVNDIKVKKLVEGGSTITQQLAKNMYFPLDRTVTRKIAEVFMALKLEQDFSKKEILELYVNNIYYGSGYDCIYDAARGYFHKHPKEMTQEECTLLAGIPNAPSVYSPDVNPDLARERQKKVVSCMKECGYLD